MTIHISITYQCSLPTYGVITSLSNKEVISTSLSLSLKYAKFSSWTEALPKISSICSSVEMYWRNYFSPLDFITEKIVLDLNVLQPVMEHRVL
jgi:hypothetical protein